MYFLCLYYGEPTAVFLLFAVRRLNYKNTFGVIGLFSAKVLDPLFPVVPKVVNSQTVLFTVHKFQKFVLDLQKSSVVHIKLKNRILNPLSVILAMLCYFAQSAFAFSICSAHIVAYKRHHSLSLISANSTDIRISRREHILPAGYFARTAAVLSGFSV